jgi:hypothetical protein
MVRMTDPATAGPAAFRAAIEAGDLAAAVALFDDDVEFYSPVVHSPYRGRDALRRILEAAFATFEDFRYVCEYAGDDGHVLEFHARVGDRTIQGVDILRGGGSGGALSELTVLVRPYSAATALRERMGALLG